MRFKEFALNESGTGNIPTSAYGVGTKHTDAWGLDTVNRSAIGATHYPSNGFQSIGHINQYAQNLSNINDPDYVAQITLQQLATFADNVIVGIDNNANNTAGHYKTATYNNGKQGSNPKCPRDWIQGLTENDIISGLFPRLKHEDMDRGMKMNIIIRRPQGNMMLFDMNIGALREKMKQNAEVISHKQVGQGVAQHVAQGADTFLNQINQGTLPLSASANPWNAS